MNDSREKVVAWENLWLAFRRAARGKRGHPPAAGFEHQVADRLVRLQGELRSGSYRPGEYTHFYIHEPKRRRISAAPFRDRVVHHALCNVIEPVFDRTFIAHSYANRRGKGTHRAIDYLQRCAQSHRYVLRMDIVKHFPSLDHAVLRAELAKVIEDDWVLSLTDRILAGGAAAPAGEYQMVYFPGDDLFAANRPRGLPIGNLTSQFWSNCLMNPLDHFVVDELGCAAYLRYVDDFCLFSNQKRELWGWKGAVQGKLAEMRLTIHPGAQVMPVTEGIPWLGWVVWPHRRRLKARNAVKFTRRLASNLALYHSGHISFAELDAGVQGWLNHVSYGDTWGLRRHIFSMRALRPCRRPRPR
jgi:RNA-directed DNA polymerase